MRPLTGSNDDRNYKVTCPWRSTIFIIATVGMLVGFPVAASSVADTDLDGIDDALEQAGGAGILFGGFNYLPCASATPTIVERYTCLSPGSKDIFVYLV